MASHTSNLPISVAQDTCTILKKMLVSVTVSARTQDVPSWTLDAVADALALLGNANSQTAQNYSVCTPTSKICRCRCVREHVCPEQAYSVISMRTALQSRSLYVPPLSHSACNCKALCRLLLPKKKETVKCMYIYKPQLL